jgi:nicotinamidase-related amidase
MSAPSPLTSLQRAALIVIDMQRDFLHADGVWSKRLRPLLSAEETAAVVENNRRAAVAMRRAKRPVIYVRVEVRADQADQAYAPPYVKQGILDLHLTSEGSWGAGLMDGIEARIEDYSVVKKGHGSFQSTHLDRLLSSLRVRDCVYTGGGIGGCVSDTVYQGDALGYRQWLITDGVYPLDSQDHLEVLGRFVGMTTTATIETLSRQTQKDRRCHALEPATGLIILGMQNDFLCETGLAKLTSRSQAEQIVAGITELAAHARRRGWPVIHAPFAQRSDGLDAATAPNWTSSGDGRAAVRRTWGAAIVDELAPVESDILVERTALSCFRFTPLLRILRNLDVERLIIVGGDVRYAISSSIRDGAGYGYELTLLEDLVYPREDPHLRLLTNRAAITDLKGILP